MPGNAGTPLCLRVGPEGASFIAREFAPYLDRLDLLNLPNYEMYLELRRDGAPLEPFSATTVPWSYMPMVLVAEASERAPTSPIISAGPPAWRIRTAPTPKRVSSAPFAFEPKAPAAHKPSASRRC